MITFPAYNNIITPVNDENDSTNCGGRWLVSISITQAQNFNGQKMHVRVTDTRLG